MEVIKSPLVRISLTKILSKLVKSKDCVGIELNGEVVAILTLNEPTMAVPPIFVSGEEARESWSELIEAVRVRNARFFFRNKKTKDVMYLVRSPGYRNKFEKRWVSHIADWKAEQERTPAPSGEDLVSGQEDLQEYMEKLASDVHEASQKINQVFALIYRQGNLQNYPELGTIPTKNVEDI